MSCDNCVYGSQKCRTCPRVCCRSCSEDSVCHMCVVRDALDAMHSFDHAHRRAFLLMMRDGINPVSKGALQFIDAISTSYDSADRAASLPSRGEDSFLGIPPSKYKLSDVKVVSFHNPGNTDVAKYIARNLPYAVTNCGSLGHGLKIEGHIKNTLQKNLVMLTFLTEDGEVYGKTFHADSAVMKSIAELYAES